MGILTKQKNFKFGKKCGRRLVGVHITSISDYMVPFYGSGQGRVSEGKDTGDIYGYLSSIDLSRDDWISLQKHAKLCDMPLCMMPNDIESMDFIEKKLAPDYFVIAASAFCEYPLIKRIASQKRKTFLRIGGASLGEIETVVEIFRKVKNLI